MKDLFLLLNIPIRPPTLAVFGELDELKYTTEFSVGLHDKEILVIFVSITSPNIPPIQPSVLRSASSLNKFAPFCVPQINNSVGFPEL